MNDTNFQHIHFLVEDGLAKLTFNRPDRLNSFNAAMHAEVRQAFKLINESQDIRCLLLTGNGRGFCAGQDLSGRDVSVGEEAPDLSASIEKNYNPLVRNITGLGMPVVCAVNGVAAGAGANIALACDLVLAAKSASFIQSFNKLGLVPDSGGTWVLPKLVGQARAMRLCLLGEKVSAESALEMGMIAQVCDDQSLLEEATTLAIELAKAPTMGLGLIKQAIHASASNSFEQQLLLEQEYQGIAGRSDDYREGVAAFMEKRQANFKGR